MKRCRKHVRCPHCGSLHTRRKGIRLVIRGEHKQWYCYDCRRAFSPHTAIKQRKAARCYFEEQASYRATADALGQEAKSVWASLIELGFTCKTPAEVSIELHPSWSGYLLVDSDTLTVGSHKEKLLLAADAYSQDIPHALLAEREDEEAWSVIFSELKERINYPIRGIIADGDLPIEAARHKVFPEIPFQLCVLHYERSLRAFLRYRFSQKPGYWRETERFLTAVHRLLYARDLPTAQSYLQAILADPGFRKAGLAKPMGNLVATFPQLVTHHGHPGMPRTTNILEGIISRLDTKITASKSYKHHDTAWATLKLLIMRYRFKPFKACRKKNKRKNGKSPLQLAGADTSKINWISFAPNQNSYEKVSF